MTDPTTALATREPAAGELAMKTYSREQLDLLKSTIAKGASDMELALFLEVARRTGLSPFAKQLIFIKVYDKDLQRMVPTVYCTVDGLRAIADDSGEFDGMEGPWWKAKGGQWQDDWDGDEPPFACKVLVYRKGRAKPFPGIVHYKDFARTNTKTGKPIGNWASQPTHMLRIRAETQALRVAFPLKMGGLFVAYDEDGNEVRRPIRDPDDKASNAQVGELFRLARAMGWTDAQRHQRAGVSSFTELTRGRAHELIEEWIELLDEDTPDTWKAGQDDPNVVDAELVEEQSEGPAGAQPNPEESASAVPPSRRVVDRGSEAANGRPSRSAQDDEDFTIVNGPHAGKTIEQVGAVDPAWLAKALEFPALPDKIRDEMKRVLAARQDVGAASNTGSRESGDHSGTPVADNPGDDRGRTDADEPPSDTAAAPADVEDVGAGEVARPSPSPTHQSESAEVEQVADLAVDAETPEAGSDVLDGELVEDDWWDVEPHTFQGDDYDAPCGLCGYAKEAAIHPLRGGPGDTHETGQATDSDDGEPRASVGPEDPSPNAAPEPAPDTSEEAVGELAVSGSGPTQPDPERPPSDDLEDPVWHFGIHKGKPFSQIAVEAPDVLREIATTSSSGPRRLLAQAWLQRTAEQRGELV